MNRIYSVTKAYHSTRQKGLKKFENRTTTATIDTGEGAHVHGWGLYLQADEMSNRKDYYYGVFADDIRDVSEDKIVVVGDNEYYMSHVAGDSYSNENQDYEFSEDYGLSTTNDVLSALITENSIEGAIEKFKREDKYKSYVEDLFNEISELGYEILDVNEEDVNPPIYDGTHSAEASQYTVEIPDDMVFIDEYQVIPEWIFTKSIESNILTDKEKEDWDDVGGFSGYDFYNLLKCNLKSDEKASLWLAEQGIDGMTYEGGRDHGCFVIYNCDKLKIVAEY